MKLHLLASLLLAIPHPTLEHPMLARKGNTRTTTQAIPPPPNGSPPRTANVGALGPPSSPKWDLYAKPMSFLVSRPRYPVEASPLPQITDPSIRNPLVANLQDCVEDHVYKGQRQPAIGVRLRHVLNFLSDADKDRDCD